MSNWINIAAVDDLQPGQSQLVELESTSIAVFNINGEYFAIQDLCTHDGSPMLGCGLPPDEIIEDDQIICPRHGARFCIRTGEALTPPAYEAISRFPVRVENSIVQINSDPLNPDN